MFADAIGNRPSTLSIVFVLIAVVAIGSVAGPVGAQSTSVTEIDACTTITDPGRYVLTADVRNSDAGTCLDVRANDVVIDGNGHAIDGQSMRGQVGIGVRSQSNVVVRDVEITEWDTGINYSQVTGGEVSGVTARSNTVGIELAAGSENTISNNTVLDNGNGIYLHAVGETTSDRNTIRGNEVTNASIAITFIGADNNTVTNNTLRESRVYGLSLLFSPLGNDYNDFRDNVVLNSTEDGVCLLRSSHNTFENTYVENSGRYDVYAVNGSTDNRMTNLTLTSATLSTTLRDVSLVAVDDPPAPAPETASTSADAGSNASAAGYVNATDTSPGPDAGTDVYLAVESAGANGSSGAAESEGPVYRYTGEEWEPIGERETDGNVTTTNVTDLGASGSHQLLAFVGEEFVSTAPDAASTAETTTGSEASTTGTSESATTGTVTSTAATTANSDETNTESTTSATDAGTTDGAGSTATGGEQATEASGPGFGLVVAVCAVLAVALLAGRRD